MPDNSSENLPAMCRILVSSLVSLIALASVICPVHSHGHLTSPRSRNFQANEDGIEGVQSGVPKREYCPHCLNKNAGVCGMSPNFDYDKWLDSTGASMPWISQAIYAAGDVIQVKSYLSTHHNGHIELRGCPDGRQSDQACFDDPDHVLTFVRDVLYDMPADPAYPERGYYYGGQAGGVQDFEMEFQLPKALIGSTVLLQVGVKGNQSSYCKRRLTIVVPYRSGATSRPTAARLLDTARTLRDKTRKMSSYRTRSGLQV